jgi:UDP-N-acetylmuramoyl-L-alanyl-D-glutamate--2,6-diaminopimelate ligase
MISEGLMQNLQVTGLCDDSRRVKPGNLFFSMPTEGAEEFAQKALDAGAVAVVAEMPAPEKMTAKWIQVMDVRRARLEAAKIF